MKFFVAAMAAALWLGHLASAAGTSSGCPDFTGKYVYDSFGKLDVTIEQVSCTELNYTIEAAGQKKHERVLADGIYRAVKDSPGTFTATRWEGAKLVSVSVEILETEEGEEPLADFHHSETVMDADTNLVTTGETRDSNGEVVYTFVPKIATRVK